MRSNIQRNVREEEFELSDNEDSVTEEFETYEGVEFLDEADTFVLMMSRVCGTQDSFNDIMDVLYWIVSNELVGQVNKAHKDRGAYWTKVESSIKISDDEARTLIDGYKRSKTNDNYAGIQRILYTSGRDSFWVGNNRELGKGAEKDQKILDFYDDGASCVSFALNQKKTTLVNVYTNLIKCFDIRDVRSVKTNRDRELKINELLDDFEKGVRKFQLNTDKFKLQKEPGVALPHTVTPVGWLTETVSALIVQQFGPSMVLFCGADKTNINRHIYSSSVFVDEDYDSPYHLLTSPALFCSEVENDVETGNDVWVWRKRVEEVEAQVKGMYAGNNSITAEDKNREVQYRLKEIATGYAEEAGSVKWRGPHGVLTGRIKDVAGGKNVFKCFKAMFSSKKEIKENPDFIHVARRSVANDPELEDWFKAILADNMTVVLFPMVLWSRSRFVKASKTNRVFKSNLALQLAAPSNNIDVFHLVYSLWQTRRMFECFKKGVPYDPVEGQKVVLALIDADKRAFERILGNAMRPSAKKKILSVVISTVAGSLTGIAIQALSTRRGKRSADAQIRGGGAQYSIYDYEDDVYDDNVDLSIWDDGEDEVQNTGGKTTDNGMPSLGSIETAKSIEKLMTGLLEE